MKTITVKYGVDSFTKQVEDDFTFGDLQESDSFKAGLGFGDNTKALVDGHRAGPGHGDSGRAPPCVWKRRPTPRPKPTSTINRSPPLLTEAGFLLFMETIEIIIRRKRDSHRADHPRTRSGGRGNRCWTR